MGQCFLLACGARNPLDISDKPKSAIPLAILAERLQWELKSLRPLAGDSRQGIDAPVTLLHFTSNSPVSLA